MRLNKILRDCFNAPVSQLHDETKLMNYPDWDSMNLMLFITRLEEEYQTEFTGDEIADMDTVGHVKELIKSKGKEI